MRHEDRCFAPSNILKVKTYAEIMDTYKLWPGEKNKNNNCTDFKAKKEIQFQ